MDSAKEGVQEPAVDIAGLIPYLGRRSFYLAIF